VIFWRRLPCRCEPCRALQRGADPDDNHCVLTVPAGSWKRANVAFKNLLDGEATQARKATAKAKRTAATALKVARLVTEMEGALQDPEIAPNPQAAIAAAVVTDDAAVTGLSFARGTVTPAFVAAYGAEDARAAAILRGDTEFIFQFAAVEEADSEEGEEEGEAEQEE
jgi:hypothetical protein